MSNNNPVIIASRQSDLALWQSEFVKQQLLSYHPHLNISIKKIITQGDRILDTPLSLIGGKGLFTKEIQETLLKGEAQIAVHSGKDMPTEPINGLCLAAVSKREDPRDCFLSQKYPTLDELPVGSIVGTTSVRRQMQLRSVRPDIQIKNLRGNVPTRIEKLKNGDYDAIILAYAGLKRLNLLESLEYIQPLSLKTFIPAMAQGVLAIEAQDNPELLTLLAPLNDNKAWQSAQVERAFVHRLNGGCQAPIGVYAYYEGESLCVDAMVGQIDGSKNIKHSLCIPLETIADFSAIGIKLGDDMIKKGALGFIEH